MRVTIVDRAGGQAIWTLMAFVAQELVERGDEVLLCRSDDGVTTADDFSVPGAELVTLPIPAKQHRWQLPYQQYVLYRQLHRLIRDWKPDLLQTNFAVPAIAARLAARRALPECRIVGTHHELYSSMSFPYRWGMQLTGRMLDAATYVSQTVATSYGIGQRELDTDRHEVILNGIDIRTIDTLNATESAGRPLVCAGRLVPEKGQATLIRAMVSLGQDKSGWHAVLTGAGPDRAALEALAGELGVAGQVRFAGWLRSKEIIGLMASAFAVVVPSTGAHEGFGLVVAEAMACGVPVVASDIPVFREVLGAADECGWLFPVDDDQQLVARLQEIAKDPDERQRRVRNARRRVEQLFDERVMRQRYLRLYDQLCAI